MCLLTFVPGGVQPDTESLKVGADANPDGHGFAVVAGERLIVGHGLKANSVIDQFAEVRSAHPDGPALFHSRIATAGEVDKSNCHPFRVGGDRRTVMAHNGIMPAKAQPSKKDHRSDTRIVAETLIPNGFFGSMRRSSGRQKFERWMGKYNKVVILTVDRRYQEQSYILNETEGTWDQGIWYSNHSYIPWKTTGLGKWYDGVREGFGKYDWELSCPTCWTEDALDPVTRECKWCGLCGDCDQLVAEGCLCYVPASLDRAALKNAPVGWPGD